MHIFKKMIGLVVSEGGGAPSADPPTSNPPLTHTHTHTDRQTPTTAAPQSQQQLWVKHPFIHPFIHLSSNREEGAFSFPGERCWKTA